MIWLFTGLFLYRKYGLVDRDVRYPDKLLRRGNQAYHPPSLHNIQVTFLTFPSLYTGTLTCLPFTIYRYPSLPSLHYIQVLFLTFPSLTKYSYPSFLIFLFSFSYLKYLQIEYYLFFHISSLQIYRKLIISYLIYFLTPK